jgi:hypothetical protein
VVPADPAWPFTRADLPPRNASWEQIGSRFYREDLLPDLDLGLHRKARVRVAEDYLAKRPLPADVWELRLALYQVVRAYSKRGLGEDFTSSLRFAHAIIDRLWELVEAEEAARRAIEERYTATYALELRYADPRVRFAATPLEHCAGWVDVRIVLASRFPSKRDKRLLLVTWIDLVRVNDGKTVRTTHQDAATWRAINEVLCEIGDTASPEDIRSEIRRRGVEEAAERHRAWAASPNAPWWRRLLRRRPKR